MSCPHQFLADLRIFLYFVFFPLGISIFRVAAWFPFDKGQSILHSTSDENMFKGLTAKISDSFGTLFQSGENLRSLVWKITPFQDSSKSIIVFQTQSAGKIKSQIDFNKDIKSFSKVNILVINIGKKVNITFPSYISQTKSYRSLSS